MREYTPTSTGIIIWVLDVGAVAFMGRVVCHTHQSDLDWCVAYPHPHEFYSPNIPHPNNTACAHKEKAHKNVIIMLRNCHHNKLAFL